MKIAVTVTDGGMAVNMGGPVETATAIIELLDAQIPPMLRRFLEERKRCQDAAANGSKSGPYHYATVMFSMVDES